MSKKQIEEMAQNVQTFMAQTIQAFGVIDNDLKKVNFLFFALQSPLWAWCHGSPH